MTEARRELSFWHGSLAEALQPRPALGAEVHSDIAIVGAGYTGLWAAWYLKRLEPSLRIAVVEADSAGYGASGRNGGWCSAWLSGIERWLDDPARRAAAIRLQKLMFQTVRDIGETAEREGIDCHYERAGALQFAVTPAQLERLEEELRYVRGLGFDESDYRWLDHGDLRQTVAVDGALAALHLSHCAAIHPARLARGLAARLEREGVTIYEESPVLECSAGLVRTAGGAIAADTVLVATEGYGEALSGRRRGLIPVHSMMVVTEPLPDETFERIGFRRRYCFGNLDRIVTYGQRTADNRIAFGCRGRYYYGSAVRHGFDPADPEFELVRSTLLRFFPALRGVRFTHAWGGALGVSRSLRPAVCFDAERRFGWAGGYFGNGVAAAHLAGRTLADLALGRDSELLQTPWVNPPEALRSWEPEPLRWLGFRATRALMQRADRAEYAGRSAAGLQRLIDRLLM
jgi:glycine/D-amino acid oxidase-like deaminating enzyme